MNFTDKIYIAGHSGLVGSSLQRLLQQKGLPISLPGLPDAMNNHFVELTLQQIFRRGMLTTSP